MVLEDVVDFLFVSSFFNFRGTTVARWFARSMIEKLSSVWASRGQNVPPLSLLCLLMLLSTRSGFIKCLNYTPVCRGTDTLGWDRPVTDSRRGCQSNESFFQPGVGMRKSHLWESHHFFGGLKRQNVTVLKNSKICFHLGNSSLWHMDSEC